MVLEYAHSAAIRAVAPNVWSVVKTFTRAFGTIPSSQFYRDCLCATISSYRPRCRDQSDFYRERARRTIQSKLNSNQPFDDEDFFGAYLLWLRPVNDPKEQELEMRIVCKAFDRLSCRTIPSHLFSTFGPIAIDIVKEALLSIKSSQTQRNPDFPYLIDRTCFQQRKRYYEEFVRASWPLSTPPRDSSLEAARSIVESRLLHLLEFSVKDINDRDELPLIWAELEERDFKNALRRLEDGVTSRKCRRNFEEVTAAYVLLGARCVALFKDILSAPVVGDSQEILATSPKVDVLRSYARLDEYAALPRSIREDYFIRFVHLVASTLAFCASTTTERESGDGNPGMLRVQDPVFEETERTHSTRLVERLIHYQGNRSTENFLCILKELVKIAKFDEMKEKRVAYRNVHR